ncbi:MAG TPA: DNA-formamidopyrimidine glycosylase family protein [Solirubrobacterales bacterium]|nr:DNA-formamidopyrimidine glycosylase family protein [Solirubrobacterales bacterium]
MAEGDTVLRTARRIDEALGGAEVSVSSPNPRGRIGGLERLDGKRLDRAEAHGKNLLLRFGDLVLHSHLGMNGAWHVYRQGGAWRKPAAAAWAVLSGEQWEAVQFGGPTLRVLRAGALRLDPQLAGLGPDILADDFDLAEAVRSLRGASDMQLGEALLDQRRIAGIGNIFKSEACFAARLGPWRRLGELDDADLQRVLRAARELMQRAVADGRHGRTVYRRAGRPCPACGRPIASRGQGDANRTTYWCPRCQGWRVTSGRPG